MSYFLVIYIKKIYTNLKEGNFAHFELPHCNGAAVYKEAVYIREFLYTIRTYMYTHICIQIISNTHIQIVPFLF